MSAKTRVLKCCFEVPSARDLQAFSRVLPTSRVGYHAGKPIESVVYCLNVLDLR